VKVIPAIDLLGGKAVRLKKGLKDQVTIYRDRPWELVAEFADAGAERIHVVDLDGAFGGAPEHRVVIEEILRRAPVPVQVGGGLRNHAAVAAVLGAGASFAVLGTAAVKDPAFAAEACRAFPGQIIVAVDAKDGQVAVEGWVETAPITAIELGQRAADWGAAGLLYTDVARDGMQGGPNLAATQALAAAVPTVPVIASGGVSSLADLRELAARRIPLAIVGRALYDGAFTVREAIAAAREAAC
jgi:phosphoribosylformimino-5-aminoimidazole carboxamide ribotide isomerase